MSQEPAQRVGSQTLLQIVSMSRKYIYKSILKKFIIQVSISLYLFPDCPYFRHVTHFEAPRDPASLLGTRFADLYSVLLRTGLLIVDAISASDKVPAP